MKRSQDVMTESERAKKIEQRLAEAEEERTLPKAGERRPKKSG
jgi:hypothetical protein